MNKKVRSLLAIMLLLAMALSLAACGEQNEGEQGSTEKPEGQEAAPEMAYTYESVRLKSGQLESGIYPMLYTEDGFYGQVYAAAEPVTAYDAGIAETEEAQEAEASETTEETGDEGEDTKRVMPRDGMKLYFVGYDGSVKELSAYQQLPADEDPGDKTSFYSGAGLNGLILDPQGELIAVESVYTGWFDGTEAEMQRDTPETWEKYRNEQRYYLRALNEDGSEKSCVQLDFTAQDSWLNFNNCQFAEDGTLLVAGDQGIFGFGSDGSLKLQISDPDVYVERLLPMRDGSVAATGWGEQGPCLYPVDLEKKSVGEPIQLPNLAYNSMRGDDQYDLYYINGMYLYGYRIADEQDDKVLNFLDVDIVGQQLDSVFFRKDGSIMCVINQYRNDKVNTDVIRVFQVPADSLPHRDTLTLAVLYGDDLYEKIVDFNRSNDKVRIQLKDYSEFNDPENDDYTAGRTKLLTEIMSGQVPDLVNLYELPYRQMASKGLLEDLYPYLDSDKELKREDFFPNLLQALEVNGGLYQITGSFNVQTLVGAARVVGDTPGWTYQQLLDALATMPDGCDPMDMYTTRGDMLQTLLCADLDHYVNWTDGSCSFDSEDFIELLEFTSRFPAEIPENMEWENPSTRLSQGRQMLTGAYLYSVDSMVWNDVQFGKEGCTYIGYPTNDGVGSFMDLSAGYAMSAKCQNKDAAWQFLRSFLTEDAQLNAWNGLPARQDVYQARLQEAMTPRYQTNEKGEVMYDGNGKPIEMPIGSYWGENGEEIQIFAMNQEQADKLWEAVTTCTKVREQDDAIYNIVLEQAQAYYSGQKSAQDVARLIQSKVTIYVNEQR